MLFIFADCVAVSPAALTLFTVRFGNGDFQSFGLGCGLGNCSLLQHNLADDEHRLQNRLIFLEEVVQLAVRLQGDLRFQRLDRKSVV